MSQSYEEIYDFEMLGFLDLVSWFFFWFL